MTSYEPSLALDTLPQGQPDLSCGWAALDWAGEWLVQPNGPLAGNRWRPTWRQGNFLLWFYAVDEDGRWLFNHAERRLAKGSGKSPFAAVVALIEFAGPCRVADIDSSLPVDERVKAKPVPLPLVEIAATAESQTANTMRMVRAMAKKGSPVVLAHGIDPGKTIMYRPETGGELRIITSSATTAEGSETTFAVGDEREHWTPSNGGTALAEVMDRNLAKSGSRMLATANAWEPGIYSVAEDAWDAWVAQQEGRTKGKGRILYDAVIADPNTDLADEVSLTAALKTVYADCDWVTKTGGIQTLRDRIWDPRTKPDVARRFYLNQPVASFDSWVTPQQWAAIAAPAIVVEPGDEVVAFFDGSKSDDATALMACRVSDGHVFTIGVWEPTGEGDVVDAIAVDAAVAYLFETYQVSAFFADVREWESFTKVSWPTMYGDQLDVWAQPATAKDPQPIAWDMRSKTREFTHAAELCEAEIESAGFTHDGDSRVARHIGNAKRRPNRHGVSIGKEARASSRKIDAAVCVIGALMVRRVLLAERGKVKPSTKRRAGAVYGF